MQIKKRHSGILHGVECNNFVTFSLTPSKRPCYNGTQEGGQGDKMLCNI